MTDKKTDVIRDLNDRFRNGDTTVPGRLLYTAGVKGLLEEYGKDLQELLEVVRDYDDFDSENDPHLEHDFGAFEYLGQKLFWKFDYYSHDPRYGSDDPADIEKTFRVLTILLAMEY